MPCNGKTVPSGDRNTLRIVICDDSRAFIDGFLCLLKNYFALADRLYVCSVFTASSDLLSADLSDTDILFLDVDMPGMNGIEAAKLLREHYQSLYLVFVTSWIEYAPAGYHVNAFRYLLKQNLDTELTSCLDAIRQDMGRLQERIQLHGPEHPIELILDDIAYLEGSAYRIVKVHMVDGKLFECRGKLSDLALQLKSKGFLRIQKSYVVNMKQVLQIRGYKAHLKSGEQLKTSEKDYQSICQQYLLWKGQQL